MTKPERSPEPWRLDPDPEGYKAEIRDANDKMLAVVEEGEVDGPLIAAAPKLLNAADAVANDCEAWLAGEMDSLSQGELLQAFVSTLREAIAEAKSEEVYHGH